MDMGEALELASGGSSIVLGGESAKKIGVGSMLLNSVGIAMRLADNSSTRPLLQAFWFPLRRGSASAANNLSEFNQNEVQKLKLLTFHMSGH